MPRTANRKRASMTESPKKILIVVAAGIGDLVLASKGMRALRKGHPGAEIHLLTSAEAAPLARNYGCIDRISVFPIRQWKAGKTGLAGLVGVMKDLRRKAFHLAVNLYPSQSAAGALRMGCLLMFSGAGERIGIDNCGLGPFLTKTVSAASLSGRHVVDVMVEIARAAGGVDDDRGIEAFWSPAVENRCRGLLPAGKPVVGINPGGHRSNRRWSPANFADVADRLIEQEGVVIGLLGGPGEENIAEAVLGGMRNDAINLSGRLTLEELTCVISRLDVLITNDSAPMHIAAAVGTPQVALFGPENPDTFHPYTDPELYEVVYAEVGCRPCRMDDCIQPVCLDLITPESVVDKCRMLLRDKAHPAGPCRGADSMGRMRAYRD